METGIRILVVDDEVNIRGLLSEILSEEGYEVTVRSSGEDALEVFRENPFPLVITDIRMEGMSGLQLLQEIKKLNPDTQVVIITSHDSLESAIKVIRLGAYGYLIKPFENLEMILEMVSRAIDKIRLIMENRALKKLLHR